MYYSILTSKESRDSVLAEVESRFKDQVRFFPLDSPDTWAFLERLDTGCEDTLVTPLVFLGDRLLSYGLHAISKLNEHAEAHPHVEVELEADPEYLEYFVR
jgi:hypothetical protein